MKCFLYKATNQLSQRGWESNWSREKAIASVFLHQLGRQTDRVTSGLIKRLTDGLID